MEEYELALCEMLPRMRMEMPPGVDDATIEDTYGDITDLRQSYSFDDPVRQAAVRAYAIVNGHIVITATVLSSVCLFVAFFMPDFYLGKQQNAVTNEGLGGETIDVPRRVPDEGDMTTTETSSKERSIYQRLLAAYRKDVV